MSKLKAKLKETQEALELTTAQKEEREIACHELDRKLQGAKLQIRRLQHKFSNLLPNGTAADVFTLSMLEYSHADNSELISEAGQLGFDVMQLNGTPTKSPIELQKQPEWHEKLSNSYEMQESEAFAKSRLKSLKVVPKPETKTN